MIVVKTWPALVYAGTFMNTAAASHTGALPPPPPTHTAAPYTVLFSRIIVIIIYLDEFSGFAPESARVLIRRHRRVFPLQYYYSRTTAAMRVHGKIRTGTAHNKNKTKTVCKYIHIYII